MSAPEQRLEPAEQDASEDDPRAATTPGGAVLSALQQLYPDVAPWEVYLALNPAPGDWERGAVARVEALRAVARRRGDLATEPTQEYLIEHWPAWTEAKRRNPDAILRSLPVRRRARGRPRDDRDQRLERVIEALARCKEDDPDRTPTLAAIARQLGVQPRTVRDWADDDPRIADLLPRHSGSPDRASL
jgi:hypothetical protein